MRTLKLKFSAHTEAVTLAHPGAKPGHNHDSSVQIVEITGIPAGVNNFEVMKKWRNTIDATWLGKGPAKGRKTFTFAEIGEGVIIRE